MPLELLAKLDLHARERPDKIAVSLATKASPGGATVPFADAALTWSRLRVSVSALGERLASLLPAGAVVMVCSVNRPALSVAFLAGLRAGLKVFLVSPSLTPGELLTAAEQSNAAGIIGSLEAISAVGARVAVTILMDEVMDDARVEQTLYAGGATYAGQNPPAPSTGEAEEGANAIAAPTAGYNPSARSPGSAGLLLHSSGTTALPKIVVRSARSLDAVAEAMATSIGFTAEDTVLACVPLCHSYGIEHGLLAPLWAGSSVRLCQGFDLAVVIDELQTGRPTIFPAVPFVYEMLARQAAGHRFPNLRRAYSAGGPLPEAVRLMCEDDLGLTVTQLFGATEIGSVAYSNPDLPGFSPGSVGQAMKGVDIRILPVGQVSQAAEDDGGAIQDARGAPSSEDRQPFSSALKPSEAEGVVAVRADSMFTGYLDGSPDALVDGFFPTGDLGWLDTFGNLTLTGRQKLLIEVAGLKVNPLEVEAALVEHPAVAECVVVPMPISQTVSRLKAVVVRTPGANVGGEELRQFLRERLAPYKVPRVFEFREDLPRSPAGKVLRQQV